jgi:hypothetical protein
VDLGLDVSKKVEKCRQAEDGKNENRRLRVSVISGIP